MLALLFLEKSGDDVLFLSFPPQFPPSLFPPFSHSTPSRKVRNSSITVFLCFSYFFGSKWREDLLKNLNGNIFLHFSPLSICERYAVFPVSRLLFCSARLVKGISPDFSLYILFPLKSDTFHFPPPSSSVETTWLLSVVLKGISKLVSSVGIVSVSENPPS